MKIPLAEHFHSIQGEGYWTGTPMHFIRLPGCSVGKLVKNRAVAEAPVLPTGKPAWLCGTWDNRSFWCDTDFNKYTEIELSDLLDETWEHHICITGGEPLIHTEVILEVLKHTKELAHMVHIETSGTLSAPTGVWLTCSPKLNCLPEIGRQADEVKVLISADTPDEFPEWISGHPRVYLSPINHIGEPHWEDTKSLQRVFALLKSHPQWRLSVQLHKYLGLP